jgi:hypothetical protein
MKKIILFLAIATLVSCKKETVATQIIKPETPIYKDTILNLKIDANLDNKTILTDTIARQTLNKYFKSKGFMLQSEVDEDLNISRLPQNKNKNVIAFLELKSFNNQIGILSYFNAAQGAVGHCVQPHCAIISNSENGIAISNEDFLPTNFKIDSIKIIDNKHIIYSNDYDCYNNKSLKKYRIELK